MDRRGPCGYQGPEFRHSRDGRSVQPEAGQRAGAGQRVHGREQLRRAAPGLAGFRHHHRRPAREPADPGRLEHRLRRHEQLRQDVNGTPFTQRATIETNVIPPGTWYGDRFSQLDLRLTKTFSTGGGTQFRAMFDLFNLFNANAVTREAPGWGAATGSGAGYLSAQVTMAGRLAKFAFQLDF